MPPRPTWFAGRDDIVVFLRDHVFGRLGTDWLLLPTAANRQPAFAMYRRAPGKPVHERFGIGVLRVEDGAVAEIAAFLQPHVFASFALPTTLQRLPHGSVRAA